MIKYINSSKVFLIASCLFIFSFFSPTKAQGIDDVGVIWNLEGTMPMLPLGSQSGISHGIILSNGNYIAMAYSTTFSGSSASNVVYLTEYTETGELIRQQAVNIPLTETTSVSGKGRYSISHPRVVERVDNSLLLICEFNHGSWKGGWAPGETMHKTILTPDFTSGYGGNKGWAITEQGYAGLSFTDSTIGQMQIFRNLAVKTISPGVHMACFYAMTSSSKYANGAIFFDDDYQVISTSSLPAGYSSYTIFKKSPEAVYTPTGLVIRDEIITITFNGDGPIQSLDAGKTWSVSFESTMTDCVGCASYSGSIFSTGGEIGNFYLAQTRYGISSFPYGYNEFRGWHYNDDGVIQKREDGEPFFIMENAKRVSTIQVSNRRLLGFLDYNCEDLGTTGVAKCDSVSKLIRYDLATTGITTEIGTTPISNYENDLTFYTSSKNQDAVMGINYIQPTGSASAYLALGKFSLCKNFILTSIDNGIVQSAEEYTNTFASSGTFSGATQTYKWTAILRQGSLSGTYSSVAAGDIITTGTTTTVGTLQQLTANFESTTGALIEIQYTSTQEYGATGEKRNCSTVSSFTLDIVPLLTTNQKICTTNPLAITAITGAVYSASAYTYQWEQSTDGGTTWTNAIGISTNQYYTPPSNLTKTTQYRRVTKNLAGNAVTTNVSTVTVSDTDVDIVSMPIKSATDEKIRLSIKNPLSTAKTDITVTAYKNVITDSSQVFTVSSLQAAETQDLELEPTTITGGISYLLKINSNTCDSPIFTVK